MSKTHTHFLLRPIRWLRSLKFKKNAPQIKTGGLTTHIKISPNEPSISQSSAQIFKKFVDMPSSECSKSLDVLSMKELEEKFPNDDARIKHLKEKRKDLNAVHTFLINTEQKNEKIKADYKTFFNHEIEKFEMEKNSIAPLFLDNHHHLSKIEIKDIENQLENLDKIMNYINKEILPNMGSEYKPSKRILLKLELEPAYYAEVSMMVPKNFFVEKFKKITFSNFLKNTLHSLPSGSYDKTIIEPYLDTVIAKLQPLQKSEKELYEQINKFPDKNTVNLRIKHVDTCLEEIEKRAFTKGSLTTRKEEVIKQSQQINQELKKRNLSGLELAVPVYRNFVH
ncbi:hypothetical protein BH747_09250 [Enterococcus villorum]|uniref:Uncharacterized protein n=1 Tax=Enterococcus villorum TaxID=112904 RepID=A0A1V8YAT7_9ENTE|nr:hypothetical protein [Enterococcus villorum]OQO69737.1 hypothetical protein BH747_09250 [Enterococcus villorum]OQO73867.1 hypothetical protein BH744_08070 [Enterococcus villorum]